MLNRDSTFSFVLCIPYFFFHFHATSYIPPCVYFSCFNNTHTKVLQPVSNQYNISDKIKEANQQLYRSEQLQRSQPKVRFRDHQLVDYEPEDGSGIEIMERRRSSSAGGRNSFSGPPIKMVESLSDIDDGYIDDEILDMSADERLIIETIEIEEVCEEIEVLEVNDNNRDFVNDIHESLDNEETKYETDDFYKDDDSRDSIKSIERHPTKTTNGRDEKHGSKKRIFRTKINPIGNIPVDERKPRNKKCCKYKETDEYKQKLPKYNGFYSHYGLSKDEIERREHKMLTSVEFKRRRSSHYIEKQEHLAKTNEEAFAKW